MTQAKIIYTQTDEAPALATYSLLPIVRAFAKASGVSVETRDISLAGRIIASFSDHLSPRQRQPDDLAELGALTQEPLANIIKLPNISASVPQLQAAIKELQGKGYALPDYPEEPATAADEQVKARYDKVKGSAVNPVLREGNSDRRAPPPVKEYARKHPHSMGAWRAESRSHVASMTSGDFYGSERSLTLDAPTTVSIVHQSADGKKTELKSGIALEAGEIVDAAFMSVTALRLFLADQMEDAQGQGVLFSLHLKATMMKVSDPIIFGHAVASYFAHAFAKHADTFAKLGIDPNNGIGDALAKIAELPDELRHQVQGDIEEAYRSRPPLAMVDSDRGITNLHVPSDVIIDASMPAAIRSSGQMWGPDGKLRDMKAVIPDRSYAAVYQQTIDFCKEHGAFDPATMGSVANVGLMAQKAEEYGSHDTTFELPAAGTVSVIDDNGKTLLSHGVGKGDIWRMCRVKDAPIRDWIKLAVARARQARTPAVFWLDQRRAHDSELIKKVEKYLPSHDTDGLDIRIMAPAEATAGTLRRIKDGKDSIAVTGNVLRDYLTDLFPILELGTSAKMLSIVPLMNGGSLFETGAGGSAPKHVRQFLRENHLRWDSLGEFLAIAASLDHLASVTGNDRARVLATALTAATGRLLENDRSPKRGIGDLDNRGSHFYLALYWAEAMVAAADPAARGTFAPVAAALAAGEADIVAELNSAQGGPVDLGGYYQPDPAKAAAIMRPSARFNDIMATHAA